MNPEKPIMRGMVIRRGPLDMQVCVPKNWTEEEIISFAESTNPSGTEAGWHIRQDPDLLAGDPVRAQCSIHPAFVHVTLDA